ncbi:leucine-rich repeat domain-containing protein [Flagellimonas oceanensis]|uniref:leucine-rich repeat domain-containing protein n=1 Tax=Flagellimonas oceanensis TaxID=2499163 RepID=UPI000F8D0911|nr:hypothetical protein [Allomuricauda oceanensis]
MPLNFKLFKLSIISLVGFLFFSCEKTDIDQEESPNQLLPIQIVTKNNDSGVGDLVITYDGGRVHRENGISYNEVQEIELNLETEGTYIFAVEDQDFGRIKIYIAQEELQNYTVDKPLTLQFEHYKNQKIATFKVQSETDGLTQFRFIDVIVKQSPTSLYHIDWGDGNEEVAVAPSEPESSSDRIEHHYTSSGEYTITLSTTDRREVTGLNLQITGNGKGDKIQTLELEELPSLTHLSLGDHNLTNIDSILETFPNLQHLGVRFGNLTSIDVSKNPLLELLIVNSGFDTEIKGLSALTKLKFLGITGIAENLDLTLYPDLYHLSIRQHKTSMLDVSQNQKLTYLELQSNELDEIDLSANINLESLLIINNNLTQLNLSNNLKVSYLNLAANQIEALDLSNNRELWLLNLYGNHIEELDLTRQVELESLNLSSIRLLEVSAPESWDNLTRIDLADARLLDEEELLDAVFQGQKNNPKTRGAIIFHDLAIVLDRQIPLLNELVEDYNWVINVPDQ